LDEHGWWTSEDPVKLLRFLRDRVSSRKMRLLACACTRLFWDRLSAAARRAVEAAESCADDPATRQVPRVVRSALLRDLFGSPFHPPPPLEPSLLRWGDGAVVKLAQAIYQERAFERLPVLADALEEAGCTDAAILGHCRQPGQPHARGCWVTDLLLNQG
jgi:hypothetical protein